MCNWCNHRNVMLDMLELFTWFCHTETLMIKSHSLLGNNLIHFPFCMQCLCVIFIGSTRHSFNVDVDMTHILSHGLLWGVINLVWPHLCSLKVWQLMWLIHINHQKTNSAQLWGMPPRVILWETRGHRRTTEISLKSLDCHMIARHLIWIRRSINRGGCIYDLVGFKPVKTYFTLAIAKLSCCACFNMDLWNIFHDLELD